MESGGSAPEAPIPNANTKSPFMSKIYEYPL